MTIVFSPSAFMSTTARRARPMSREISCVRPPMRPLTDSRSLRLLVARGSIAYSAVTQPLPLPVSQRGTPPVNDAVHSTFVPPKEMRADPSACALQPRSIVMGRSWSRVRPSARRVSVMFSLSAGGFGASVKVDGTGLHEPHGRHLAAHHAVGEPQELVGRGAGG